MSEYPTIVSFYTDTWDYKKHAIRLARECDVYKLPHHIVELPDTGRWIDNTRLKPKFIYDAIREIKRPILWLDVDASILNPPDALKLPISYDFMGVHQRIGPMRQWHVGTMFFNYNDAVIDFLGKWVELSESGTDEANFETLWERYHITSKELPLTYYYIPEVGYNLSPYAVVMHRLSKCPTKNRNK